MIGVQHIKKKEIKVHKFFSQSYSRMGVSEGLNGTHYIPLYKNPMEILYKEAEGCQVHVFLVSHVPN